MSTLVNGKGLMHRRVLLLQWGVERARCPVQQYLLNQGQQGWGPNELTIATRLSHHSKCQDASELAFYRVSQIPWQLSVCLASGISLARMGDCSQATLDLWQLSVCLQHRRGDQSPLKWWSHLSFLTGIEQPLAESPTREGKRTAVSRPYGTPQVDLRHMLRKMYHRMQMRCCLRYQKTEGPNTMIKKVYTIYLIKVAPDGSTSPLSRELEPQKEIGRVDPSPLWRPVKQDMWHQ